MKIGDRVRARYLGEWVTGVIVGEAAEPGTWLVGEDRNVDDARAFHPCELELVEDRS